MKKIAIIFNVTSGLGDPLKKLRRIRDGFQRYALDPAFFFAGDSGREIRREVRIALEEGFDTIIAAGGDGTVSSVASELANTQATLAVIPNGTFNFFAKFIGAKTIEEAIKIIVLGKPKKMDIGQVNGHVFLNNSSLGLHARLIYEREKLESHGFRKWLAYPLAFYQQLKKFQPANICFSSKQKEFCQKTPLVFIGNNEYPIKNNSLSAKNQIRDGQFGLYIAQPTSWNKMAKALGKFFLGWLTEGKDYSYFQSSDLVIHTKDQKKFIVSVDGEVLQLTAPLHYQIKPHALKVIFPAA